MTRTTSRRCSRASAARAACARCWPGWTRKQQALILGHAVPMPVVVQTRRYDMDFYKAMGFVDEAELPERLASNVRKMRGEDRIRGV